MPAPTLIKTHLGDLAEEEDAIGGGWLEGEALRLVLHKLGHELEQRGRHRGAVRPGLQAHDDGREVRRVQPVKQQPYATGKYMVSGFFLDLG